MVADLIALQTYLQSYLPHPYPHAPAPRSMLLISLSLLDPFSSTPLLYILRPHEISSIRLFCIHIQTYLSYEYTGITILVCAFFPFFPSRIRTLSLFSNSIHVAFVAPSPSFCPQCSTWTILPKAFACSPHDHSPFFEPSDELDHEIRSS